MGFKMLLSRKHNFLVHGTYLLSAEQQIISKLHVLLTYLMRLHVDENNMVSFLDGFIPMHPIENKKTERAYPVTWTPSWRLYSPCPQTNSTWAWLCPPPPPPQDLQAAQHCISSHIHCPHWRSQCRSKIVTLVKSQNWLRYNRKKEWF